MRFLHSSLRHVLRRLLQACADAAGLPQCFAFDQCSSTSEQEGGGGGGLRCSRRISRNLLLKHRHLLVRAPEGSVVCTGGAQVPKRYER